MRTPINTTYTTDRQFGGKILWSNEVQPWLSTFQPWIYRGTGIETNYTKRPQITTNYT